MPFFNPHQNCPKKPELPHSHIIRPKCPHCSLDNPNYDGNEIYQNNAISRVQDINDEESLIDLTASPESSSTTTQIETPSKPPGLGIPARHTIKLGEGEVERQKSIRNTKNTTDKTGFAKSFKITINLRVLKFELDEVKCQWVWKEPWGLPGNVLVDYLVRILITYSTTSESVE